MLYKITDITSFYHLSFLICITFTFRRDRLPYLIEQIRCLSEWPVGALEICFMTSALDTEVEETKIALEIFQGFGLTFEFQQFGPFSDPYMLTWMHKDVIRSRFLKGAYTHFLYIEDDMRVSWRNAAYWLNYRDKMAPIAMLPGFLRYEVARGQMFLSDVFKPQGGAHAPYEQYDNMKFYNIFPPYHALYFLDQPLANEHVASSSFEFEASKANSNHYGTAERANIGQSFEDVPYERGFHSRYLVPMTQHHIPYYDCLVHNLPNNYANRNPKFGDLGALPVRECFQPAEGYQLDTEMNQQIFPGEIRAWHGNLDAVPSGWRICDGTGGTKDLRYGFGKRCYIIKM